MKGVISVIIPVYNVSAYLPECLDSVLNQDYPMLEVILIDDGSTDDSGRICDEYSGRDSRIRVVHQKNGGAAAAKNAGLRVATGEYLAFVDSDDYLERDAYSYMMHLLQQYEADVVQCRVQYVFCDGVEPACPEAGFRIYSAEEYIYRYTVDWTCALMTDKLYKRALFNGIFFEEGHSIDDEFFTYQGMMNAKRVIRDDKIVYHYRMRKSSVMHSPERRKQMLMDRLDYLKKRRDHVIIRFPQLCRLFNSDYLDGMIVASRHPHATKETMIRIKRELRTYISDKNRTMPGVSSWPALLYIFVASVSVMMRLRKKETVIIEKKNMFP